MNSIDIFGIGKKKKSLPDPSTIKFESLQTYLDIATRIVRKHGDKIKPGLTGELLRNEDAMSNIAFNIMMGDWQFNGKGDIKGWRSQMGQWAIYNYINRADRRYRETGYSLDMLRTFNDGNAQNLYDVLSDDTDDVKVTERGESIKHLIQELLSVAELSDRQREVLRLHYLEGVSVKDIITKHDGKTKQNVSTILQRGIAALIKVVQENPYYAEMYQNEVLS